MKKFRTGIVVIAAITLSVLITACGGNNNEKHDGMMERKSEEGMNEMMEDDKPVNIQSGISPIMASYMDIKNALVSDDSEQASKFAENMLETLGVKGAVKISLQGIAGSNDLKEQRKHFRELSEEMYRMAKEGDMGETLYWNHCPMAMNNTGANWLSMNEKISNPYMGQKMPGCGSVQETLNE